MGSYLLKRWTWTLLWIQKDCRIIYGSWSYFFETIQIKPQDWTEGSVSVVKEGIRFGFCAINLCLSLLVHYEEPQRDLLQNHLRWPGDKRRILEIPVQALLSSQRTYSEAWQWLELDIRSWLMMIRSGCNFYIVSFGKSHWKDRLVKESWPGFSTYHDFRPQDSSFIDLLVHGNPWEFSADVSVLFSWSFAWYNAKIIFIPEHWLCLESRCFVSALYSIVFNISFLRIKPVESTTTSHVLVISKEILVRIAWFAGFLQGLTDDNNCNRCWAKEERLKSNKKLYLEQRRFLTDGSLMNFSLSSIISGSKIVLKPEKSSASVFSRSIPGIFLGLGVSPDKEGNWISYTEIKIDSCWTFNLGTRSSGCYGRWVFINYSPPTWISNAIWWQS